MVVQDKNKRKKERLAKKVSKKSAAKEKNEAGVKRKAEKGSVPPKPAKKAKRAAGVAEFGVNTKPKSKAGGGEPKPPAVLAKNAYARVYATGEAQK